MEASAKHLVIVALSTTLGERKKKSSSGQQSVQQSVQQCGGAAISLWKGLTLVKRDL